MSGPDPTPNDDETLVAYLDGQLPAEDCERIEACLATDESTRRRVRELDSVWLALDSLPRTTTSASFTQTTVDMAALGGGDPATPARRPRLPWRRIAVGFGGLVLGVLVALTVSGRADRRALGGLPTALHAEALENAGSLDFLTGLVDRWPGALRSRLADKARDDAAVWSELDSASAADRRAWLVALPPGRVDGVAERVEAFRNASGARRDALVRLDRRIGEHPRREELRTAALAYDALIATLSPGERARLRGLSVEERLSEVERKAKSWSIRSVLRLSDTERDELLIAIDGLAEDTGFAAARAGAPGEPSARQLYWFVTQVVKSGRGIRSLGPGNGAPSPRDDRRMRWERLQRGLQRLTEKWPAWAARLEPGLPEDVREQLAKAKTDQQRAAWWDRLLRGLRPDELSDAFADLPNDRMEDVLLLPREELTEALDTPPSWRRPRGRGGPPLGDRPPGPPPPGQHPPGPPRGGGPPGWPPGGPR